MEHWTEGPLLYAKFHPYQCNDKVIGPPKLKFLLRFYQNSEFKRPTGAYALRDFHKICTYCTLFQVALAVKIWMDLLKGLQVKGVLRRACRFPKIFSTLWQRNYASYPKRFRGARTCSRSSITMPSLGGSNFTCRQGSQKRWVFLFVCLFLMLLNFAGVCQGVQLL